MRDSPPFIGDYVGAQAKGVTVSSRTPRQTLSGNLDRNNVDEELPLPRDVRKPQEEISRQFVHLLANQQYLCAKSLKISSQHQVLL